MESILFRKEKFDAATMGDLFSKTFYLINQKLSDQYFTRFNSRGEATGRLAPAYFEAVCAAFVSESKTIYLVAPDVLLDRLRVAFNSQNFKNATGPGANTIPKLHQRIEIVTGYLCGNIPA